MKSAISKFTPCLLAALIACGGDDPTIELAVTSPTRGTLSEADSVVVSGTVVFGDAGALTINGEAVAVVDGAFEHTLALSPGTTVIETVASEEGAMVVDRRAISAGALAAAPVDGGVIMRMGSRGMASQSQAIRDSVDMAPIYSDVMGQLLVNSGTGCTLDQITATALDTPVQQVFMYGLLDTLGGEVLFLPIDMSLSADYMDDGCTAQTGTFDFDTVELHWTYNLDLTLGADPQAPVEVALSNTVTLYDHELIYTNNNIDPLVFDRVISLVDANYATRVIELTTPEIERRTADAFNAMVTATLQPSSIDASAANGIVVTYQSDASASEPSYVPSPEPVVMPGGADAAMTIADDAVNAALGVAWRAGVFDVQLPSGATLELLVPPTVRAGADGPVVVVGDWMAGDEALAGSIALAATNDGTMVGLVAGTAALASGDNGLTAEASAALGPLLDQVLVPLALPIGPHADEEVAATLEAGYIEIRAPL